MGRGALARGEQAIAHVTSESESDQSDQDESDDEASAGADASSLSVAPSKRKPPKSAASASKRRKMSPVVTGAAAKRGDALLRNIDMEFTFQGVGAVVKVAPPLRLVASGFWLASPARLSGTPVAVCACRRG
jgi:hypothetical protein